MAARDVGECTQDRRGPRIKNATLPWFVLEDNPMYAYKVINPSEFRGVIPR